MKRLFGLLILTTVASAGVAYAADPEFKTDDEKTLYALGLVIANQLGGFKLSAAELELVKAGLTDGTLGKTPKVDLEAFGPKIQPMAQARRAAAAGEERKKGKEFLEKTAANPKIKKLADGVLLESITEGTGASPGPSDGVKVNYKGTLIDGKVFDASEKHGGPQTFRFDGVVKCWGQAIQFMKVGGKAKLYCPPDSAWGDRGSGPDILPGATVIFEVELIDIVKDTPAKDAPAKIAPAK